MSKTFKRRNYFIDKGAQSRFIAGFALASVVGGIVAVFSFRYFAQKKIDATLYSMRLPEVPMGSLLMQEMLITLLVSALLVIILFALTARKVFSRIDGPLKKMAGSVRNITGGDLLSEVRLRENDDFRQFATEVNIMAGNMKKRFRVINDSAGRVSSLCSAENISADELKSELDTMKKEIRVFKI